MSFKRKKKNKSNGNDGTTKGDGAGRKHVRPDTWDFDNMPTDRQEDANALAVGLGVAGAGAANVVGGVAERVGAVASIRNADDAFNWVDELLPDHVVRKMVKLLVTIYGFIGCICILFLIGYSLDLLASSVLPEEYEGHSGIWLRCIIGLISVGAGLGMYVTFKFGDIDEQIDALQEQNEDLMGQVQDMAADADHLQAAADKFLEQIESQAQSFHVQPQVEQFEKLEKELREKAKGNSTEIDRLLKEVDKEFKDFKSLQIQLQKANLLNLFYEKVEFGDGGKLALNEAQYDMLLARLDMETADLMNPFKKLDKNRGGTIDLKEFQREIDRIFNTPKIKKRNKSNSKEDAKTEDGKKKKGLSKWIK